MSTVATTHRNHRPAAVTTARSGRPGSARSLLIAWMALMAFVSLALALL
ncbi:hypothetical protein [Nocardia testacea]|nr:hypothetical protein [Nocardia testacea]